MSIRGLKIIRPLNVAIATLAVIISLRLSDESLLTKEAIFSLIVIALLTGFANSLNDYYDVEMDMVGHPDRPLVKGYLSRGAALLISVSLCILAFVGSIFINYQALALTLLLILAIYVYNKRLKSLPFIGNLTVSVVASTPFLFIFTYTRYAKPLIFPFIFSLVFHIGRELIKDLEDMKSDRLFELKTLPNIIGEKGANFLAAAFHVLLILVSLSPVILGFYGNLYLIVVLFGMDVPLLYNLFSLLSGARHMDRKKYNRISRLLKITILPAFLGLYFGGP